MSKERLAQNYIRQERLMNELEMLKKEAILLSENLMVDVEFLITESDFQKFEKGQVKTATVRVIGDTKKFIAFREFQICEG